MCKSRQKMNSFFFDGGDGQGEQRREWMNDCRSEFICQVWNRTAQWAVSARRKKFHRRPTVETIPSTILY